MPGGKAFLYPAKYSCRSRRNVLKALPFYGKHSFVNPVTAVLFKTAPKKVVRRVAIVSIYNVL